VSSTRCLDLLADAPAAGLAGLSEFLGFGESAELDDRSREALGLPADLRGVRVAPGPGTTRALLVEAAPTAVLAREQARVLAHRLAARAPHLLWLLILIVRERRELVVAAWRAGAESRSPRIAALVVDCGHPMPSDVETLEVLAASGVGSDLAIHGRWLEILGREAISTRFFLTLQRLVRQLAEGAVGPATAADQKEIALLHVSRLLFLSFLEARGWLDGNRRFLVHVFDQCMARGGGFQRRVLQPLFFGTLNTPVSRRAPAASALGRIPFLNGGLFTRSATEVRARRLVLRDAEWGQVFDDLLLRYRFSAAEETTEWQEAAIDPEMLGRAFESLMAARERRVSGAYFTPFALVARTADTALEAWLESCGVEEGTLARVTQGVTLEGPCKARLQDALGGLRLLDPACGTGAFLVHALDRLTQLRIAAGDPRAASRVRRDVIARSIFGVDINPTAVWLCELRLWLALVIDHAAEDRTPIPPLPNLDHNIRCGDTLSGGGFPPAGAGGSTRAGQIRDRYVRATGTRKRALGRELDRLERARHLAWLEGRIAALGEERRSLIVAARGRNLFGARRGAVAGESDALRTLRASVRDLRRHHREVSSGGAMPFAFAARFPDAAAAGGFDMVVGNPPWVRLHHLPVVDRERWRREYRVFRDAAWASGARLARAGAGFGSQVDAASLFIERGLELLRPGGVMSYLVPSKLWRSLAGGGVRRLLSERTQLLALEDWSDAPAQFDAATYPSLLAVRSGPSGGASTCADGSCRLAIHRGRLQVVWRGSRGTVPLDDSPGAPWLTLPPEARSAFDRLGRAGVVLAEAGIGTVTLGVKTGCNEAFLVRVTGGRGTRAEVTDGARRGEVEASRLRPVLRGEAVRSWCAERGDERIIFLHGPDGRAVSPLPEGARTWLRPWRARLEARSDARQARAWWSLFRLEGASPRTPRVVWADIGRSLQAMVLPAGDRTVPLNTCYVLPTRDLTDAHTLAALFNSALVDAWLSVLCEPARGGYRRHLAWCMARIPVPDDWVRARAVLGPLGERGMGGDAPGRAELLAAVLDSYRLRHASVAGLLAWMNH
jgi:hypothetical protein